MGRLRNRTAVLLALLCALLLAWLSLPQEPPAVRAEALCSAADSFWCDIGGGSGFALKIVVQDAGGTPVAGALCRWTQVQCNGSGCGQQVRSGQTDEQGQWVTDHCVDCSREWTVLVERSGFSPFAGTFTAGAAANGGTCTLRVVLSAVATPTPTRPAAPTPQPPEVHTRAPEMELFFAPPYPVVVGQDPERRGVDVCLRGQSYPVVRVTYNVGWDEQAGRWVQVAHTEMLRDPIDLDSIRIRASLTDSSQRWIAETLARIYPGLAVQQAQWQIAPHEGWQVVGHAHADGRYLFQGCNEGMPLADPGWYDLEARYSTTGTPWSPPLWSAGKMEMPVAFLGVSLVE